MPSLDWDILIFAGVLSLTALIVISFKRGFKWLRHFPSITGFPFNPLLFTVLAMLVILAADPRGKYTEETFREKKANLMIVMDISGSMRAEDIKPNRLIKAKEVIKEFVKKNRDFKLGLITFAGKVQLKCPITSDYEAVESFIDSVDFEKRFDGTAIGNALLTAKIALQRIKEGDKFIILLTDGENNVGYNPIFAAKECAKAGIKVFTVGLGSEKGAPVPIISNGKKIYLRDQFGRIFITHLDEATLKKIAQITEGKYYRATTGLELAKAYDKIASYIKKTVKTKRRYLKPMYKPFVLILAVVWIIWLVMWNLTLDY